MATNEETKRGSDDEDRLRSLLGAADRDLSEGELIEKYVVPWREFRGGRWVTRPKVPS